MTTTDESRTAIAASEFDIVELCWPTTHTTESFAALEQHVVPRMRRVAAIYNISLPTEDTRRVSLAIPGAFLHAIDATGTQLGISRGEVLNALITCGRFVKHCGGEANTSALSQAADVLIERTKRRPLIGCAVAEFRLSREIAPNFIDAEAASRDYLPVAFLAILGADLPNLAPIESSAHVGDLRPPGEAVFAGARFAAWLRRYDLPACQSDTTISVEIIDYAYCLAEEAGRQLGGRSVGDILALCAGLATIDPADGWERSVVRNAEWLTKLTSSGAEGRTTPRFVEDVPVDPVVAHILGRGKEWLGIQEGAMLTVMLFKGVWLATTVS